jgi:hypothetical protein
MKRQDIVALAAKRLGDESAGYVATLDSFFDSVLRDFAEIEAIELLRKESPFDLVQDQENYSTRTMTGIVAPFYPLRILNVWVPTWGREGIVARATSDNEYMSFRQRITPLARGRFRIWQVYPNITTVRLWPPVDADNAGTGLGSIKYIAQPTTLGPTDDIVEIRYEDLEVIVNGLVFYGAPFRDETMLNVDRAGQLYQQGRQYMWGRTFNGEPGKAEPNDF